MALTPGHDDDPDAEIIREAAILNPPGTGGGQWPTGGGPESGGGTPVIHPPDPPPEVPSIPGPGLAVQIREEEAQLAREEAAQIRSPTAERAAIIERRKRHIAQLYVDLRNHGQTS